MSRAWTDLTHTVVIKAGNAFVVSTPEGDIPLEPAHPLGLYRDDCRFLSGHELRVAGQRPRLLVAAAVRGAQAVHELTNPEIELPGGQRLAPQSLRVRLERTLVGEATLVERLHVRLYGRDPVALELELALAADFRPVLALREIVPAPPAAVGTEAVAGGVRFAARRADGVLRATTVRADPAPVEVPLHIVRVDDELVDNTG